MTITATYSPEDNKLRLYPSQRLDAETFERVKAAGFKWAPRQELFVAPKWTCAREDLATELAGEIEPEEMTLAERAELKAERLDQLASKRSTEANAFARRADEISERFAMGQPILVGHHSERRARKDQERMHAATNKANEAHRAANYWLYRAEGVERFATMKNSTRTRANRIKTLLAELRDLQRAINSAHGGLQIWEKITEDRPDLIKEVFNRYREDVTGGGFMTWSKIDAGELDAVEARAAAIENCKRRIDGENRRRWINHTLQRLGFERSLLGPVARFEGELTAAILQTFARTHGAHKPKATETDPGSWELSSSVPLPLHLASGDTLDLTADDWRDLMQSVGYEVPKKKAAMAPILNIDTDCHMRAGMYGNAPTRLPVVRCTKAEYSAITDSYRGVMPSACGGYRFKVAMGRLLGKEHGGEHGHNYVAVFLTDSKEHAAPQMEAAA